MNLLDVTEQLVMKTIIYVFVNRWIGKICKNMTTRTTNIGAGQQLASEVIWISESEPKMLPVSGKINIQCNSNVLQLWPSEAYDVTIGWACDAADIADAIPSDTQVLAAVIQSYKCAAGRGGGRAVPRLNSGWLDMMAETVPELNGVMTMNNIERHCERHSLVTFGKPC